MLDTAADKDHGFLDKIVTVIADLAITFATVTEQHLVAALMRVPPDMCARFEDLQAGREIVVRRIVGGEFVDDITGGRLRLP